MRGREGKREREGKEKGREEEREERRKREEWERRERAQKWLSSMALKQICGCTSKLVPLDTSGNGAWYKMYLVSNSISKQWSVYRRAL